jgi:hypothetical protein
MTLGNQDYENFADKYHAEEREILVFTSDDGGAGRATGEKFWTATAFFLAYVDIATGELKQGNGRIIWPLTDEEEKGYLRRFQKECIYRLRVRELIDKTVPNGGLPSFQNRFLVVNIIEKNAPSDALEAVLEEYRKPVTISDPLLGTFTLNKRFKTLEGSADWLGTRVSLSVNVNMDSNRGFAHGVKALRVLFDDRERMDADMRAFAADKLIGLANDWRQEDGAELSDCDFIGRIRMSELSASGRGGFTAVYNDGGMFLGHAVVVRGDIKKGLKSATIEG